MLQPWTWQTTISRPAGAGASSTTSQTAIQTRIIAGDFPAGARLRQEQLAAEYRLSRTPIREALRKLQAAGTVELVPNQGAVVRGTTVRDVREGYEVRAELEGMAAALAATWITDEHLSQMREAEALFRGATGESQSRTWARANDQFHEAVQAAAGNERLRQTIRDLHKAFPRRLTWGALEADSSCWPRTSSSTTRSSRRSSAAIPTARATPCAATCCAPAS